MDRSRRTSEQRRLGLPRWITGIMLLLAMAAIGLAFLEIRWPTEPIDSAQTLGAAAPDPHRQSTPHELAGPSTLTTPNAPAYAPRPVDGPATPTTPKGR